MSESPPLSWFYQLDPGHQAVLLARPHGYVPADVAARIADHADAEAGDDTPAHSRRWLLRSAEANLLEDERHRLDEWWSALSESARTALVECRGVEVPQEYRHAVLDVVPGGVSSGMDMGVPFVMSGIAAAYLDMVAAEHERAS